MTVLLVLDLLGVFVFALSGAAAAIAVRLDLFGIVLVASAAALGGGLARDVLLGALPPAALLDARYLVVPVAAGVLAFAGAPMLPRVYRPVLVLDAAGLGLFVASGTTKALDAGLGAVPAAALGVLTGIGGGLLRDVLVGVVPVVLRREIYAVPALLGAALVVAGDGLHLQRGATAAVAASVVMALRLVGLWRNWHFPVARS